MRQLTSLDAQFLAIEDGRIHGHTGALAVFEPRTASGDLLDAVRLKEMIRERLPRLEPLRWRLLPVPFALDHPYWVDAGTQFDLDHHVTERTLPAPGGRRELAEVVSDLVSQPMDRSRPLWRADVIHGLHDGAVAILLLVHHALIDGVSGAQLLTTLMDFTPDPAADTADAERLPAEAAPSPIEMLGRGAVGAGRRAVRLPALAARTLPYVDAVATIRPLPGVKRLGRASRSIQRLVPFGVTGTAAVEVADVAPPRTRFASRLSGERRVAFGSVSLDEVKAVKRAAGCTVNDVVVAVCTTALRGYLGDRGELPEDPLVAWVPTSVRPAEGQATFGNQVVVMLAEIPTDEPDAGERLARIAATLSATKQATAQLPATLIQDANDLVPPALLGPACGAITTLSAVPAIGGPANVIIANIPTSPVEMYCAGARQQALYPISAILEGVGLNITVFSYLDHLEIGVVADASTDCDPWELVDRLRDSLTELAATVLDPVPC